MFVHSETHLKYHQTTLITSVIQLPAIWDTLLFAIQSLVGTLHRLFNVAFVFSWRFSLQKTRLKRGFLTTCELTDFFEPLYVLTSATWLRG